MFGLDDQEFLKVINTYLLENDLKIKKGSTAKKMIAAWKTCGYYDDNIYKKYLQD